MARKVLVYADWSGMDQPVLVGLLAADVVRGKEVFSFEYADEWLQSSKGQMLDPDLQLYSGPDYPKGDKPNFGIFLDSSPDRWGRVLMKRREAILARQEDRPPKILYELDFLLGVFDSTRMGGLRFKENEGGEFMGYAVELATPPWTSLRELEYASLQLENDKLPETEEMRWLMMLMAPGSSLGGARPKASVTDPQGNLWIAKFPSINDEYDIGAWEMVAYELALKAGINLPPAQLLQLSGRHHTFMTQRFDRVNQTERIHFASAMTLLGHTDGAGGQIGVSYLDLAEIIIKSSNNAEENLKELWTRMVFNVLIKNTDDHLRNHGFLLRQGGWEFSPAYDLNPNPRGSGLTLNISEDDNSLDTELALSVAKYFRLKHDQAKDILDTLKNAVAQWRTIATKYKLSKREQDYMAAAFN